MEALSFNLELKTVPVTMKFEDGDKDYTLKELTGKSRDAYMQSLQSKMRFGKDGKPAGLKSFEGLMNGLLTKTLFNEDDEPVKADEINTYPSSVVGALFTASQELSGLNLSDEDEEELGND